MALTGGDPAPHTTRRMPTRVSNACRRCRRNKSRVRWAWPYASRIVTDRAVQCDSFRPCSLCLRADAPCDPAPIDESPGSSTNGHDHGNGRNPRKSVATVPLVNVFGNCFNVTGVDEVHLDAVTAMTTRLPRSPRDSLPFLRGMLHQREQRSHLPEAERRDLLMASVHGCPQIIM